MPEREYGFLPNEELVKQTAPEGEPSFQVLRERIEERAGDAEPIEIIEFRHEHPKTPEKTLFLAGWGEDPTTFLGAEQELAARGRDVFSFAHPRRISKELADQYRAEGYKVRNASNPVHHTEFQPNELRRAINILEVMEHKKLDRVNAVTHSEGFIAAAIAASLRPDRFSSIVGVAPSGMIGKHGFVSGLVRRYAASGAANIMRAIQEPEIRDDFKRWLDGGNRYVPKNLPLALSEAQGVSASEIHEVVRDIHKLGINVAIIHGEDDPIFPIDKLRQKTEEISPELDALITVQGNHEQALLYDAKNTAQLIDNVLEGLEKSRAENSL